HAMADPSNIFQTYAWTFVKGVGIDPASTCVLGNAAVLDTTINCGQGGPYSIVMTASDGVNPPVTASASPGGLSPTAFPPGSPPGQSAFVHSPAVNANFAGALTGEPGQSVNDDSAPVVAAKTSITVYNPADGRWYILPGPPPFNSAFNVQWGTPGVSVFTEV